MTGTSWTVIARTWKMGCPVFLILGLILLKIDKNEKFLLLPLHSLNRYIFLSTHDVQRARAVG